MSERPVALQLLPTLAQGGAELYVYRLVKLQRRDGPFAPAVCSLLRSGPVEELLREARVPVEVLGIERASIRRPWAALRDWRWLLHGVIAAARRHRAALIQTHLSDADWLGLQAGRRLGIPVVLTFHSSKLIPPERDPREFRARLRTALQARFYRRADALIAVGSDVRDSLLAFPGVEPERVHLVPSAIELPPERSEAERAELRRRFAGLIGDARHLLVAVGRAVPSKGHDRLIRMMPRILAALPGTRLWIVGDGPERQALADLVAELGLGEAVLLLGRRHDVAELLPCADLYLTGTHREGLGLAVAEGMAAGLPAVGFRVSGVVDTIEEGVTGRLIPDGDLDAFADAVVDLLRRPEARAAMAPACRRTAERFDVRRSREQTEAIYQRLLAGR
ncbi:MAG: glycosyltransferase family 1 protein [Planctomycetota bacterium]|nr:MAG: glycosyltransferase family 1 protein [Planctomycetota bacterium]